MVARENESGGAGKTVVAPAISDTRLASLLPPEPSRLGQKIGPYQIVQELGRGGMGTVYLAERADEQFNQREGELSHGVSALDRHAGDLSEYAALMESNKLEVECQATFILSVAAADPDDVRAQAKALAALVPKGPDGKPVGPPSTGTCPTREGPRGPVAPVLDPAVWEESVSHLPGPRAAAPAHQLPHSRPATRPSAPGQGRLPLDQPGEPDHGGRDRNRVDAFCDRCATRLPVGAGRVERIGEREIVRCDPACPPDSGR